MYGGVEIWKILGSKDDDGQGQRVVEEGSIGSRGLSEPVGLLIFMMTIIHVCSRHDGTLILWLRFVHLVPKIPKAVSGYGVHS